MVVKGVECEEVEGDVDGAGEGDVRVVSLCWKVLCCLRTIIELAVQ